MVARKFWPWAAVVLTVAAAVGELHRQGRQWICTCGRVDLWVGQARGSETSQHLFDPYGLSHIEHGLILCALLVWLARRLSWPWRFWIAVTVESLWEVIENTNFIIERYRQTGVLGYVGDTVVNSVGDIGMCALGFVLAWYLGWRRSLAVFVLIEAVLIVWIRDSMVLSLLTLLIPVDTIAQWQTGHA